MIDALMAVGAMETVTAVKLCGSTKLLGGSSSWEDALLNWVNGVRKKPDTNTGYYKHTVGKFPPVVKNALALFFSQPLVEMSLSHNADLPFLWVSLIYFLCMLSVKPEVK